MIRATGLIETAYAAKYIKQLCNHWGHKLAVEQSDGRGVVHFPQAVATMVATVTDLTIGIEGPDEATVDRMKDVVTSHLDRFAFREAPLTCDWSQN